MAIIAATIAYMGSGAPIGNGTCALKIRMARELTRPKANLRTPVRSVAAGDPARGGGRRCERKTYDRTGNYTDRRTRVVWCHARGPHRHGRPPVPPGGIPITEKPPEIRPMGRSAEKDPAVPGGIRGREQGRGEVLARPSDIIAIRPVLSLVYNWLVILLSGISRIACPRIWPDHCFLLVMRVSPGMSDPSGQLAGSCMPIKKGKMVVRTMTNY